MEQSTSSAVGAVTDTPVSLFDQQVALLIIACATFAALLICLLLAGLLWLRHRRRRCDKEEEPLRPHTSPCLPPDNPIVCLMPAIPASETGSEPISDFSGFSQSSSSSSLAALHSASPLASPDRAGGLEHGPRPATGSCLGVCVHKDLGRAQLVVRVTAAKRLPNRIRKHTVDAYVKVCLLPGKRERYTTRVVRSSREPVFNEEFIFDLKGDSFSGKILRLTVYDYDKFARHNVLGTVLLPLSRLDEGRPQGPTDPATTDPANLASEELWLPLDERYSEQVERVRGMLEVSLCYSASQQTLLVEAIRAKQLQIRPGEAVTLYVKLSWFERRRLIRTRKSKPCRETCDPSFHERLTLPLATRQLSGVCLTFAVCATNKLGVRYTVGRCSVGPIAYSTGSGLQQWNTMIHSADREVVMWHNLT